VNDTLRRILTTLVIIACGFGLVVAAQHTQRGDKEDGVTVSGTGTGNGTTGSDASAPASNVIVELKAPTPDSSVLSQAQLLIDLTTNYDASFVVNGVTIPDDQLQKRPELNQVIFTPGPGKVIEKFPAGRNCVEADIYRVDGAQEDVPPARWCFNVT
jgi:hypothetical protein